MKIETTQDDVVGFIIFVIVVTIAIAGVKGCSIERNHDYRMRQSTNQIHG